MKTCYLDMEAQAIEKITELCSEREKYVGSLLDNYIFIGTDNIKVGRRKPRKFMIVEEKYVNCWTSSYRLIMTDSERTVEKYRKAFES